MYRETKLLAQHRLPNQRTFDRIGIRDKVFHRGSPVHNSAGENLPSGEAFPRLGGDEFAVVATVEEAAALSQARALAEDVLAVMRHPTVIRGRSTEVACSIGVAIEQGGDAERDQAALGDADYAMYTAKQQGKNRIEVFAPGLMTERPSRAELRRDLVHAAADDQLVLHYQPVVDLQAMQVVGHEALLRWDHPTRGLLGPDQFVSLAEDSGDILGIGAWVLDRACADLLHRRYGIWPKVIMALLIIYFPVTSAFFDALMRTPQSWLDLARVMGASPGRTMRHIRIPAALPGLASGLRLAAVYAPIGVIISEWVGASQGLGYLILLALGRVKVDLMFATTIALALMTLLVYAAVDRICRRWLDRAA